MRLDAPGVNWGPLSDTYKLLKKRQQVSGQGRDGERGQGRDPEAGRQGAVGEAGKLGG